MGIPIFSLLTANCILRRKRQVNIKMKKMILSIVLLAGLVGWAIFNQQIKTSHEHQAEKKLLDR